MIVGILALQGAIEAHEQHLKKLGATARLVKTAEDLTDLRGLILPGGESTTMIRLAKQFSLWSELQALMIPCWGVCAGSILMAKEVENPAQESLALMDIKVRRNAYGRQLESFQQELLVDGKAEQAVFIRAPKFVSWGSGVKKRGTLGQEVVFLDDGKHMVTAFHPELTDSSWFHELFLQRLKG
jgi:5'-phosphate synthase pdxT subunit